MRGTARETGGVLQGVEEVARREGDESRGEHGGEEQAGAQKPDFEIVLAGGAGAGEEQRQHMQTNK